MMGGGKVLNGQCSGTDKLGDRSICTNICEVPKTTPTRSSKQPSRAIGPAGRPSHFAFALRNPSDREGLGRRLNEGTGMVLRGAGMGLLVGASLVASSIASAAPALVFEPYSGTVLYAEDPDAQWFPASLTKLMTAYVTFEALKASAVSPNTKVVCSQKAKTQAPSKLDLPLGASITLDVALKVLIVKSANDVAVMIAEAVAGSQDAFIARMNETAQHLGMNRTHFANVNGLPDDRQVTTARDLATLARAIIVEFPEHADLFSLIQVQVGKKTMRTHNSLLVSFPGADGMKTGFICESGFNVVASATRDGRKLVAVVLGEPSVASRNDRATDLLDKGFNRYFWKSLFGPSLNRLAFQAPLIESPTHLRASVCGPKSKVKRSGISKLNEPDVRVTPGRASAIDASDAN